MEEDKILEEAIKADKILEVAIKAFNANHLSMDEALTRCFDILEEKNWFSTL